jgi:hypothetical protein
VRSESEREAGLPATGPSLSRYPSRPLVGGEGETPMIAGSRLQSNSNENRRAASKYTCSSAALYFSFEN